MLVTKTYWKWNEQFNDEQFNLGDTIDADVIEKGLIFDGENDELGTRTYQLKSNAAIYITVDAQKQIIKKAFFKGARIGKLKVRSESRLIVRAELTAFLEECEKDTQENKLMIVYADLIMKAAILTQGKAAMNIEPHQSTG